MRGTSIPDPNHPELAVRRPQVFVDQEGRYGSRLTVVEGAATWSDAQCLAYAGTTGTSETVFVDEERDAEATIRIFVAAQRIRFAGYPLIGLGRLLVDGERGEATIHTDEGPVVARVDGAWVSVACAAGLGGRPWRYTQLATPAEVLGAVATPEQVRDYVWAWEDEAQGRIRARAFASASGYAEDEATGSAAIDLAAQLGRPLEIRQGRGSVLYVRPVDERVELRGRVMVA